MFAAVVCLAAAIFMIYNQSQGDVAKSILITCDGNVIGEYSLTEDRVIPIETELGYNLVTISGGEVCVTKADCANQDCVQMGSCHRPGEIIVCLPHKLMVTVMGPEGEIDAIAK